MDTSTYSPLTVKDEPDSSTINPVTVSTQSERLVKKSRYIPKRLLSRVEKLEEEKAPVREILILLGVKL